MARRTGLGAGRGKGFKNIIPNQDRRTHSNSARGIKQPQRVPFVPSSFFENNYPNYLTPLERRIFDKYFKVSGSIEKSLEVVVNTVEGDISQLSPELQKYALKKGLIDSDGDGVIDKNDCQPLNPKKQDDDSVNIEFEPMAIEPDESVSIIEPEKKKNGFFKRKFKAGVETGKRKLEEQKEKRKKQRLEELQEVNHPVITKLNKQHERVATLQTQHDREDDYDKQDKLDKELDIEKDQLRNLQEQVTEIKVEDLSDGQLKTLAIRHKSSGFSLFGSGNEFQDELLRRVEKRKELNLKIKEQKNKPVEKGFFEDMF